MVFIFFALLIPNFSQAAISFTNGYWETSFIGCNSGDVGPGDICDGLEVDDYAYNCNGSYSQISSLANYSLGEGDYGYRMFQGDERNIDSSAMKISFVDSQDEIWIRYYTRYPLGQSWGGIFEHKMIYAFTNDNVAMNINFPQGMHSIGIQPRGTMGSPDIYINGWGWNNLYGSDIGDGSWHLYEHHFKLGSSGGNNGVYQFWVDGVNRVDMNNLDFFNGGSANPTAWDHINLPSNHNVSTLAGCNGIDIDDIALANESFSGFTQDLSERDMIGGLSADTISPSSPSGLVVL
ncbi:MAG: hypothetical protein V3574_05285 [Candidatus Moraniibacteriota bacterium]